MEGILTNILKKIQNTEISKERKNQYQWLVFDGEFLNDNLLENINFFDNSKILMDNGL